MFKMNAEGLLLKMESSAISTMNNGAFVSSVTGKSSFKTKKKKRAFSALFLIVSIIIIASLSLGMGNVIPSAISDRILEETNMQHSDAVESTFIIFKQKLVEGSFPVSTAKILKEKNVLVGYIENNSFKEGVEYAGGLVLKIDDKIIYPTDFINEVHNNTVLYDAVNQAVPSDALLYFDEAAEEIFKGKSTRNNYTSETKFDEVMKKIVGNGSDISVNSVSLAEKENEDGEITMEYIENGTSANSKSDAWDFVNSIVSKFTGTSSESATMNVASTLDIADTITKEDKAERFALGLLENISKMKAGDGAESQINDVMNYMFDSKESEVYNLKTGQTITVTGSMLESPSLYALLSRKQIDASEVEDYSSDRIIKNVEKGVGEVYTNTAITSSVASVNSSTKGVIGRLNTGSSTSNREIINSVTPIISSSLIDNSFETINGINAGEMLVEGAVSIGKKIAQKSGGTSGDEEAVLAYNKLRNTILALDAKADRLNRSPFDITSKNTFLGSIVYNFATSWGRSWSSVFSRSTSLFATASKSLASILPIARADDTPGFLSNFGDCRRIQTFGGVGSVHCTDIMTFDVSTLNDPYSNPEFVAFVDNNTTLSSTGQRVINDGSILANFLQGSNRQVPLGVVDGGILESLSSNTSSSSIPFISSVIDLVKNLLGADNEAIRIASGAAFINSKNNPNWKEYKLAQRYVALARMASAWKDSASDETVLNNLKFFEGKDNPVVAYMEAHNQLAER